MSDQLTLEGVALEKKDKSELQSIVAALGGKPSARARKSDLIDQILELSGVTTARRSAPPADGPADTGPADTAGEHGPVASAAVDDAAAPGAAEAAGDTERPVTPGSERRPDRERTGQQSFDRPAPAAERDAAQPGRAGGDADRARGDNGDRFRAGPGAPRQREDDPRRGRDEATGRRGEEPSRRGPDDAARRRGPGDEARSRSGDEGRRPSRDDGRQDAEGDRPRSAEGRDTERGPRPEGRRPGPDQRREQRNGNEGQGREPGRPGDDRDDVDARGNGAEDQGDADAGGRGDDEAGARRRRRRGRDRDRDRDREESQADPIPVEGFLDLRDEGYGFLRVQGYLPSREDVYVSVKYVRQHGLRRGDFVTGWCRPAARNEKNPALHQVDTVNGRSADDLADRRRFEDLTPLFPDQRLRLEARDEAHNMTTRIIDLVSPIGKGQRGLIVSPPKAGKTTVMKQIARAIETNNPEVELIVLLVDERPEEVTDMKRWLQRGSVVASTFDRPVEEHCAVAELTLERAKRMVEEGRDVCIILDGITRLARAYNLAAPGTGRVMSGGVDSGALYPPKKFFGAARNLEEGGSLTILATALVDTGSKMDEVIFEEFKGTGNMELRLDRRLAEKRIFPAVDVKASSTRHEELLFERRQVSLIYKLRRVLAGVGSGDDASAATELLIDRLSTFRTNDEFLAEIAKSPA